MNVTHPQCGITWVQRGNQSGHCAACHRTFGSLTAFDAHQSINDDGHNVCADPSTLKSRDGAPRFRVETDAAGASIWRSAKALDPGVFK